MSRTWRARMSRAADWPFAAAAKTRYRARGIRSSWSRPDRDMHPRSRGQEATRREVSQPGPRPHLEAIVNRAENKLLDRKAFTFLEVLPI